MEHSIAAKYAARPAAHFVRPSARTRERRLGLHADRRRSDRSAERATVLRRPDVAPARAACAVAGGRSSPPTSARPPRADRDRASSMHVGAVRASRRRPAHERRLGAVARLRTATATSAGGVVVRHEDGRPWLVVGSRRRERDGRTWTLPKGTPERGETTEETALREVAEETGLAGPDHRPARLDRVLLRPVAARASTRPSTTS